MTEVVLEDRPLPHASASTMIEWAIASTSGLFNRKLVVASINSTTAMVACTGADGGWTWDAVRDLAERQLYKIHNEGRQISPS